MKQRIKARVEKIERTIRGNDRLGRYLPLKAVTNRKRKKKGVIANA